MSPSPHADRTSAPSAPSAPRPRNARRGRLAPHPHVPPHPDMLRHRDLRGRPPRAILVLLDQLAEVDDDLRSVASHDVPIHAARRASLDEGAIGLVLRLV